MQQLPAASLHRQGGRGAAARHRPSCGTAAAAAAAAAATAAIAAAAATTRRTPHALAPWRVTSGSSSGWGTGACMQHESARRTRRRPAPGRCATAASPQASGQHAAESQAAAAPSPAPVLGGLRIERLAAPAGSDGGSDDGGAAAAALPEVPPLSEWSSDAALLAGCEPGRRLRVAVLVSGGVDSSVALALAAAAGHEVAAFYLQIWFQEDFRNFWDACPWEEDLTYARQACEALGVPLEVVPMTDAYWARVVAHSVAEIKAGRTPNPDMLCNSRVKFGAFLEWLDTSRPGEFDCVASGHYARLVRGSGDGGGGSCISGGGQGGRGIQDSGSTGSAASGAASSSSGHSCGGAGGGGGAGGVRLALTPDAVKDQTYFLAQLSPAQLARAMFPLGALTKPQVRALAAAAGLATSGRKDSQGICFLGKVKFGEFVEQHLGCWRGPLVDADTGAPVGLHDGYWFYTVGQRGGIKLPGGPWYVVAKDMALNTVTVSRTYHAPGRRRDAFVAGPINWLGPERPLAGAEAPRGDITGGASDDVTGGDGGDATAPPLLVKVRHGPHAARCRALVGTRAQAEAWAAAAAALLAAAGGGCGSGDVSGGDRAEGGPAARDLRLGDVIARARLEGSDAAGLDSAIDGAAHGGADGAAHGDEQYCLVLLNERDQGLAAGQYAVFYQGGACLGAAKIVGAVEGPRPGTAAAPREDAGATAAVAA